MPGVRVPRVFCYLPRTLSSPSLSVPRVFICKQRVTRSTVTRRVCSCSFGGALPWRPSHSAIFVRLFRSGMFRTIVTREYIYRGGHFIIFKPAGCAVFMSRIHASSWRRREFRFLKVWQIMLTLRSFSEWLLSLKCFATDVSVFFRTSMTCAIIR